MKIDPPTQPERAAARQALIALVGPHGRAGEGPLRDALLMARAEEIARDLCAELVLDARDEHGLTWSQIGAAFGMSMQSAHWRFTRTARSQIARLRR